MESIEQHGPWQWHRSQIIKALWGCSSQCALLSRGHNSEFSYIHTSVCMRSRCTCTAVCGSYMPCMQGLLQCNVQEDHQCVSACLLKESLQEIEYKKKHTHSPITLFIFQLLLSWWLNENCQIYKFEKWLTRLLIHMSLFRKMWPTHFLFDHSVYNRNASLTVAGSKWIACGHAKW